MLLLMLFVALCGRALGDDVFLTRGLSAKLIIVPVQKAEPDGPTFKVRLELINDGVEGSAGLIPMQIRLSLLPSDLHLRVVDDKGNELPRSFRTEDQMIALWKIQIPPGGRLDFPSRRAATNPTNLQLVDRVSS